MTFWGGSGSADPCLWLMDPDPDPWSGCCYFRHWSSRCQQKTNFLTQFFLLITFSYYFCMMIEGSGSGSIPLTSGSGSGSRRPKKNPDPQHCLKIKLFLLDRSGRISLKRATCCKEWRRWSASPLQGWSAHLISTLVQRWASTTGTLI